MNTDKMSNYTARVCPNPIATQEKINNERKRLQELTIVLVQMINIISGRIQLQRFTVLDNMSERAKEGLKPQ